MSQHNYYSLIIYTEEIYDSFDKKKDIKITIRSLAGVMYDSNHGY